MPDSVTITVNETQLQLFAMRAALCTESETLFVADPHLGKEATFRRGGVPVPQGSTEGTLKKISELLIRTDAKRLVILGDMFHARSSLSADVRTSVESFWDRHRAIEFVLIQGNHDTHVGRLPASWPIRVCPPGERIGRLALAHHPGAVPDGAAILLCGHLHPAIRLDRGSESVGKLACFWLSDGCLVFPAIGEFTGTHVIHPKRNDQTWVIAGDEILAMTR